MLRDKNLIPLSHQHQHALALCVRLDRALQAGEVDVEAWQAEIAQIYGQEIGAHFSAEEKEIFPAAMRCADLQGLVQELLAEHIMLRNYFERAAGRTLDLASLQMFASSLAAHIRKEERQLFEGMQRGMDTGQLKSMGEALERALHEASDGCILPTEATRLRGKTR